MRGLKEMEPGEYKCPHCGEDVSSHVQDMSNIIKDIDCHLVKDDKLLGEYTEWKSVYKCPHCGKKFYEICQH